MGFPMITAVRDHIKQECSAIESPHDYSGRVL